MVGAIKTDVYKVVNGARYHKLTPPTLLRALERARRLGYTIAIEYGDTRTGRPDGRGYRFLGSVDVGQDGYPRLNPSGATRGHLITPMDIVRVTRPGTRKALYQHPKYPG